MTQSTGSDPIDSQTFSNSAEEFCQMINSMLKSSTIAVLSLNIQFQK
jgi:hypothetical protein